MISRSRKQKGFSLIELLIVTAIIGMATLVTVPAFMKMYRANRLKNASRSFATNMRGVRQQAIANNRRMRVTFEPEGREYFVWAEVTNQLTGARTWRQVGLTRSIETAGSANSANVISFGPDTGFPDTDPSDDMNEIVFNPNGTIATPVPPLQPTLTIETSDEVEKTSYEVRFGPSGQVTLT